MFIKTSYKIYRSVIPMILLCGSVGWCYAWSLFTIPIAEHMNLSKTLIQFTFCLNILLLGLGAAFFGNMVERKLKASAALSTILLGFGFLLTWHGLHFRNIVELYLGSGVLCGLAQGIAYVISPKNLLLWWSKTKYKATVMSMSIICFGLGSSLCSILFNYIYPKYGIETTVLSLGAIYTLLMSIGTLIVNKPKFALTKIKKTPLIDYGKILSDSTFKHLWIFMFLNISAGLILIGNCASILKSADLTQATIIAVMFICGISNGLGRLVFPVITDFLKTKMMICFLIIGLELCLVFPTLFIYAAIPLMIILVNATYGAAFSVLPSLVSNSFGNTYLTTIHGMILSAWGFASVFAYVCSTILNTYGITDIGMLVCILSIYVLNFLNVWFLKRS